MYLSKILKEKNIAEYLLYMWQVEDLIRANGCDIERIKNTLVDKYSASDEQKKELIRWYEDLMQMMHDEGVMEKGHLQINKNIIILLSDLHAELLHSPKFPFYAAAYYKALPFIVELRARGENKDLGEIETCFDALYGVMLLKLQKTEVSEDTLKAIKEISAFLSMLANYYDKDRKGEMKELHEDMMN